MTKLLGKDNPLEMLELIGLHRLNMDLNPSIIKPEDEKVMEMLKEMMEKFLSYKDRLSEEGIVEKMNFDYEDIIDEMVLVGILRIR